MFENRPSFTGCMRSLLLAILPAAILFASLPSRADEPAPASTAIANSADVLSGSNALETLNLKWVFEELGEDATLWYQHVQTLANPYFEGRADGSAGMERARDYLEFFYRSYGLEPAFPTDDDGTGTWVSYRQPFEFQGRPQITITAGNGHASINGHAMIEGDDFVLLGNSGSGEASGPITFVGYGVTTGPAGYSSFDDDTDLTGRIAMLLRYEPLDETGKSRWSEERFSVRASMGRKMNAVRERGAAGIMLVTPPDCADGRRGLETLDYSASFGSSLDIPVMHISTEAAQRLLAKADPAGQDLMAWRHLADTGAVTCVNLDDDVRVTFGGDVERKRNRPHVPAANLGAVLRGRGGLADEWLVIGAHFDHNGYGWFGTDPSEGPLMPGADDNASGTAGVLVLAKMLSELYAQADDDADLRSVLFLSFDAEERGLHGSRNYREHPTVEPANMTAMLNMDMIGRVRGQRLSVFGTGTGVGLEQLLARHFEDSSLIVNGRTNAGGGSDHAAFIAMEVPAMFFFTGMHEEYTSPADQAYTVNPVGAADVLDLVYNIAVDLVTRDEKLAYNRPETGRGEDRGYARVRLGIRPDSAADLDTGIRVEGVSEGTSAHEAGIQAGDILMAWDGSALEGMRDLFQSLQQHEPGDVVILTVKRGDETLDVRVTLKASTGRRQGGRGGGPPD